MGSDCSNCTKCDLGILSEKQNEIDRQSLEYRKRNINREELINFSKKFYGTRAKKILYIFRLGTNNFFRKFLWYHS